MKNQFCCKQCQQQLEMLREKMIVKALKNGLDHPDVLKYSQEVDKKHNYIMKKQRNLSLQING